MKKIQNIISSEVIVRANNFKFKQEFGTVGFTDNLSEEGNSTIFITDFTIDKIIYVTLNGINLIEGKHYFQDTPNTIKISNEGSPIKSMAGNTNNILVGYHYLNNRSVGVNDIKTAPSISTFYMNKYSGKNESLTFDFVITPRDGKNIYWTILKDGNETPLFTGNSLKSINGEVRDTDNEIVSLTHHISNTEYLARQGDKIPFTFIVIYDLSEDGSKLNEKLIESIQFNVDVPEVLAGTLNVTPELVDVIGQTEITGSYNINGIPVDSPTLFSWKITEIINEGAETIVKEGNQSSDLFGTFSASTNPVVGQNSNIRYFLSVLYAGSTSYLVIANDKVVISVPSLQGNARAGYVDASIVSYVDPSDGVRKKIGSLGTTQDVLEYNNRIPEAAFTKSVDISYLEDSIFISAPVYLDPVNPPNVVYFVIELPDSWGPVVFNQTLGPIDISAFNVIALGNGYTAYVYVTGTSSSANPSDYFITKK
jgi:hypothetical protein